MPTHLRSSVPAWIAAAVLLTTGSDSRAAERIVVRIYDNVGVAAAEMAHARGVAGVILQGAGLRAEWRDCSAGCTDVLRRREVVVRIVTAPQGVMAESLGCATIDLEHRTGALATVYADRINAVASRNGVDAGTLLGRAVAHEIGHLLLGTARHSAGGLMRAFWSDQEVQQGLAVDWIFAPDDVAGIGQALD